MTKKKLIEALDELDLKQLTKGDINREICKIEIIYLLSNLSTKNIGYIL